MEADGKNKLHGYFNFILHINDKRKKKKEMDCY